MTFCIGDMGTPDSNPSFYSVDSFIHLKDLPENKRSSSTPSWHVKLAVRISRDCADKFCYLAACYFKHHS